MLVRALLAAVLLLPFGPPSAAVARESSSLVVVIPKDPNYHQPGCPLVAKAGRNVKVMTRAEAVQRGLKPHACPAAADKEEPPARDANAVAVYVQAGDTHYHTVNCRTLKPHPTRITLEEAGKKYWPCPVCRPPIRQKGKG